MRNFLVAALLLISHVLLAQQSNFIKNRPFTPHVVEDYGNFFTRSDEAALEKELISFRDRKGYPIVIITLSTLTDNTGYTWLVEEAALQYFNKWGIGSKRSNNGVLILLSKDPRRIRIATGSGIEGKLTDEECQQIIDRTIVPEFKMGRYYAGLKKGVKDIEAELTSFVRSTQPANNAHSGTTAPATDGWSSVDEPEQPQALAQTQQTQPATPSTPQYSRTRKPLTFGETIMGILLLSLFVWLRVRYVKGKGQATGNNFVDYVNATGYVFLWFLKIFWWILICCFGIFAIFFGYNVWRGRGSGSGSSGSARASYGGGSSSGGGATGSW